MVLATFTAWSRYLKLLRLRRGTARTLQITHALDLLKHCWAPFETLLRLSQVGLLPGELVMGSGLTYIARFLRSHPEDTTILSSRPPPCPPCPPAL